MSRQPQVKTCGLKIPEDVRIAERSGADAIGFVFAKGSPREIDLRQARRLSLRSRHAIRIGLFVNEDAAHIRQTAAVARLDAIQLHGNETPQFAERLSPLPVFKAFAFTPAGMRQLRLWLKQRPSNWVGLLIDAPPHGCAPGQAGGSGLRLPWREVRRSLRKISGEFGPLPPLLLAGGLDADNARQALRESGAEGVDASSGLERIRGRKDPHKLARYARAARRR